MAYSEKVIDHYENPRNVGKMNAEDPDVGTGMVGAPACGDVMRLQIKVNDAGHHRRCQVQDLRLRFGYRFQLPRHRVDEGQDPGRSRNHQEHSAGRRTGPAASENSLLGTR